ncbi:hypothetical protein M413DRAFT_63369 [Hebeloma cylindrosporum]|uniref:Uncharacterized protein n=1 Tax=Hebeloma cylindrosporum TaxID=76867 RepID=A0A0C2Z1B5_HEBCY|nr:hypothetical protein M413DRAFT_63369 [Hebeloma cylindrosporum h7]
MQHPSGSEGWLPTEEPAAPQMPEPRRHAPTRATSTSSARIKDNDNLDATIAANAEAEAAGTAPRRATSLGSRKSVPTVTERPPVPGPAFMGGAGVTGPKAAAEEDVAMTTRNQEARDNLTVRQRSRIAKDEAKHDKRLSKIIIEEGKTEKEALAIALDDLDNVQKLQKKTVKNEGRLLDSVARLQLTLKRAEADFLDAKTRCDMAQAAVNAELDNLETLRNQSRRLTEELQRKTADINTLRSTLAVDEREREVKLAQLRGAAGAAPSFWT